MGIAKIINKTDTAANWASANPVLADGELGYSYDTHILKIGDGSTTWGVLEGVRIASNEVLLGSMVGLPRSICYPENLNFVANYNIDGIPDATWARGVKTGTAYEGATVLYNVLDLTGGVDP